MSHWSGLFQDVHFPNSTGCEATFIMIHCDIGARTAKSIDHQFLVLAFSFQHNSTSHICPSTHIGREVSSKKPSGVTCVAPCACYPQGRQLKPLAH